jgi:hypothetical protein
MIGSVTPLLLAALGLALLVGGSVLLASFGSRFRIGRLLATTPRVSIAEARVIAIADEPRYVRIEGRIDAEEEFEDADHRPLVFRRTRLEARRTIGWQSFEEHRQTVPFVVREGLDEIGVDGDAIGRGLVVVPRHSEGVAADLGGDLPAGLEREQQVRLVVEQVSSVEHAIVVGVPRATETEMPVMTTGLGRPLIVSVLEQAEAMRVLAAGGADRIRLAAAILAAGTVLLVTAVVWTVVGVVAPAVIDWLVPTAFAASAEPTAGVAGGGGGDPRSNGQGPGLVGSPGVALLVVVGIALAAVVVTTAYVRWTKPNRTDDRPRRR